MTKNTYNGWTNYETWLVKLWIDNDEGTQSYFAEQAEETIKHVAEDERVRHLAEAIKESHEESLPKLEGFAADLMSAALSEVNWEEIANSLLEDAKEQVSA